jgi:hypothetical protein
MSFAIRAIGGALLCASVAVLSPVAFAGEPDNSIGCLHMSKQVNDAVAANQQSPNLKAATDEQKVGRDYCLNGFYATGMSHYSKALDLLGAGKS